MAFLKKYCKVKATSILESVIALSIISICLYFGIMIFSMVFSPRTSVKFYNTQNKVNELFYLSELEDDSLKANSDENLIIEEQFLSTSLKEVKISYKDSTQFQFEKSFYIQTNEE